MFYWHVPEFLYMLMLINAIPFFKSNIYLFIYLIAVLGVCTLWYKGSYNVSNISYLNYPLSLLSPIPAPLIPGIASTGIIFAFIHMYIHCLHHIHLPTPFLATSPFPPVPTTPSPSDSVEEKNIVSRMRNMTFC
jgi:hypothetical protein